MSRVTQLLIRSLQKLHATRATHLALGERGETEAYFHLQQLGYRMVATNFRAANDRGEVDLIGWDGDVLCFVEVKTRADDSFAPPSTAVTAGKRKHILSVARRYLRHLSQRPSCRFDILSVVPGEPDGHFEFTLQKGAFTWSTESSHTRKSRYFDGGGRRRP